MALVPPEVRLLVVRGAESRHGWPPAFGVAAGAGQAGQERVSVFCAIRAVRQEERIEAPIFVYTNPGRVYRIRADVLEAGGNGTMGDTIELFAAVKEVTERSRRAGTP